MPLKNTSPTVLKYSAKRIQVRWLKGPAFLIRGIWGQDWGQWWDWGQNQGPVTGCLDLPPY